MGPGSDVEIAVGGAQAARRWGRLSEHGERGAMTMGAVMLLGGTMILLTAIVVKRGTGQSEIEAADIRWEEAIHVAEAGIDVFVTDFAAATDTARVAMKTGQTQAELDSREAIFQAAADYGAANPSAVRAGPAGDVVVLHPDDEQKIYSVSFVPGFDTPGATRRAASLEYDFRRAEFPNFSAEYAFLTGGDADLASASSGVYDLNGASSAHVHANGSLAKDANFTHQGCALSTADDTAAGFNCPAGPVGTAIVPDVSPRVVHDLAHFDLCADGTIHAGPAHSLGTVGAEPCTGPLLTLTGWTSSMKQGVRVWQPGAEPPGVYYVDGGDFDGKLGGNIGPREMTIIAATTGDVTTCDGVRSTGNIYMSAGSWLLGHPSAGGLTLVAGGDILYRGNAEIEGLSMAHEQIDFRGGTGNGGSVIAESACDHPSSPVRGSSGISGGTGVSYAGPITTPFTGYTNELVFTVLDRKEH